MLEVLEKPAVRRMAAPMSREAYRFMTEQGLVGKKTERIQGVVIEKMSKSPTHSAVVKILQKLLSKAVGDEYTLQIEQPLSIGESDPEPDLAVVKGAPEDSFTEHPDTAELVIEVAHTSLELDRVKADIYAEGNVPRYIIVDLKSHQIEEYSLPTSGKYTKQEIIRSGKLVLWQGVAVDLRDIFR